MCTPGLRAQLHRSDGASVRAGGHPADNEQSIVIIILPPVFERAEHGAHLFGKAHTYVGITCTHVMTYMVRQSMVSGQCDSHLGG